MKPFDDAPFDDENDDISNPPFANIDDEPIADAPFAHSDDDDQPAELDDALLLEAPLPKTVEFGATDQISDPFAETDKEPYDSLEMEAPIQQTLTNNEEFSGLFEEDIPDSQEHYGDQNDIFPRVKPGETHFAIWGTTQAGKTTFLAALMYLFQSRKFNDRHQLNMTPANAKAVSWHSNIFIPLFQHGKFPDATTIAEVQAPAFNFTAKDDPDNILFWLTFIDGPGELFRNPDVAKTKYGLKRSPLDYMRECQGVIMLVDPTRARKGELDEEYEAVAYNLQKLIIGPDGRATSAKLKTPVAFCLTKCDEPLHRDAFDNVESFADQYFSDLMVSISDVICQTSRWFATSALGFDPDGPTNTYIRWNGTVGVRDPRSVNPINVFEPFEWLLHENQKQ